MYIHFYLRFSAFGINLEAPALIFCTQLPNLAPSEGPLSTCVVSFSTSGGGGKVAAIAKKSSALACSTFGVSDLEVNLKDANIWVFKMSERK